MKMHWKTWSLAFLAAALMTGCGSDNATGGATSGSGNSNFTGTNNVQGTNNFEAFIVQVERGNFQGTSLGTSGQSKEFYWQNGTTAASSSDNCKTKWGIFTYCSYSSSTSYNGSYLGYAARRVDNNGNIQRLNFADLDTFGSTLQQVQNNLVARMKMKINVRRCVNYNGEICYYTDGRTVNGINHGNYEWYLGNSPSTRYIFDHGGFTYLVDTTRPLAANPVGIMKADGSDMKVFYGTN